MGRRKCLSTPPHFSLLCKKTKSLAKPQERKGKILWLGWEYLRIIANVFEIASSSSVSSEMRH
jgi:hypothetical protein